MNIVKTGRIWGAAAALGLLLGASAWAAPGLFLGKTTVEAEGTNSDGGVLALEVEEEFDDGEMSIKGGITYVYSTGDIMTGDADAIAVVGNTAFVSGVVTSSTLNPTAVGNSFAVKVYENEFALDQMGAVLIFTVYLPGVALNPGFQYFYDSTFLPSVGGPRDLVDGTVKIQVE